jgi:hypothetical protein
LVEVCPWNLLEQSNAFSTSPWSLTRATLTSGQSGYDGLTNAWKYTEGTFTANLPVLEQSFTSSSDVETYSFYLKAGTRNWVAISVQGTGYIWINLTDGTVGSAGGGTPPTATTQLVGNGWYLVSVSSTGTKFGINLHITDANNSTFYNGNGTGFVYVQNAQRNIGTTAKPYFPTTDRLNVPRLTYQNGGGGCPSLLLEKQSTNLITYSEQFDNAAWSKSNVTITANNTTSPDGTQNADLSTATAGGELLQGVVLSTSTSYTFSFYVKKGTASDAKYRVYNFDAGVNVVAPTSYISQTSTSDWVRVVVSFTTGATGTNYGIYLLDQTSAGTMYFWGAQAEVSSYPTSYIPTTSASATRVADACFKTGISSLIGQTEGVIFWDINFVADGTEQTINISDGTNFIYLQKYIDNKIYTGVYDGSFVGSITSSVLTSGRKKIAFGYILNSLILYINGVSIGTDLTSTIPTCDRLSLTVSNTGSIETNNFILFPTKLTNAELASLTTI